MKTLYHQKSGKSFIFLILKKRHYISSVILLYISTLQAGKHRLFLNILLFGKLQIHIRCYPCILHLYVDILFSTVAQLLLQVAFILCKCTERQHLQHIPLHQLPLQFSPVILISSYTHDSALLTSLLPPASACFVTVLPFTSTYYHI